MAVVARVGSIWLKTIALGTAALLDVVTPRLGYLFIYFKSVFPQRRLSKRRLPTLIFYKTTAGKLCLQSFDPEKSGWEEVNLLVTI